MFRKTANENPYKRIPYQQEESGKMISIGPICHPIRSNYRKPMKILFYLHLV